MRILSLRVTAQTAGRKVRQLLRGELHISYTLLQSLKWREGAILLNGQRVNVAAVAREGDVLTVNVADEAALSPHILPVDYPLDILWEDEDLLLINKPAGLAVHSAALTEETVTVAGAVAHYLGGGTAFHPVNRLDRGVTGVMAVAKNGHMHERCMALLHTDDFRREYRGVSEGVPSPAAGAIDLPIGREADSVLKRRIDPMGQEAHTVYEVLSARDGRAFVRLRPLTGRTHQLRLHMAAMGCPLVGDWLYGAPSPLIDRPALHSCELWLRHPLTGEMLHITAPLPPDMAGLV